MEVSFSVDNTISRFNGKNRSDWSYYKHFYTEVLIIWSCKNASTTPTH